MTRALMEGSLDSALVYAARAVAMNSVDTSNLLTLARTFRARGETGEALAVWRRAARFGSHEAIRHLGPE